MQLWRDFQHGSAVCVCVCFSVQRQVARVTRYDLSLYSQYCMSGPVWASAQTRLRLSVGGNLLCWHNYFLFRVLWDRPSCAVSLTADFLIRRQCYPFSAIFNDVAFRCSGTCCDSRWFVFAIFTDLVNGVYCLYSMLHDTDESEGTVVILLSASAASISFFQFRYYIDTIFTKYRDVDIDIILSQ